MNGCELFGQMKQIGLPLYVLPPDGASVVSYLQLLSGKTTTRIYTNLSCLLFSSSGGMKALRKCSGDAVINLRSLVGALKENTITLRTQLQPHMESLEKLNVMFVYICLIIQECFNVLITRFGR